MFLVFPEGYRIIEIQRTCVQTATIFLHSRQSLFSPVSRHGLDIDRTQTTKRTIGKGRQPLSLSQYPESWPKCCKVSNIEFCNKILYSRCFIAIFEMIAVFLCLALGRYLAKQLAIQWKLKQGTNLREANELRITMNQSAHFVARFQVYKPSSILVIRRSNKLTKK